MFSSKNWSSNIQHSHQKWKHFQTFLLNFSLSLVKTTSTDVSTSTTLTHSHSHHTAVTLTTQLSLSPHNCHSHHTPVTLTPQLSLSPHTCHSHHTLVTLTPQLSLSPYTCRTTLYEDTPAASIYRTVTSVPFPTLRDSSCAQIYKAQLPLFRSCCSCCTGHGRNLQHVKVTLKL